MENYRDREVLFVKHKRGNCWLFMYREGTTYKTSHYCSVLYCEKDSYIEALERPCSIGNFVMEDNEVLELRRATSKEIDRFKKFFGEKAIFINYAGH